MNYWLISLFVIWYLFKLNTYHIYHRYILILVQLLQVDMLICVAIYWYMYNWWDFPNIGFCRKYVSRRKVGDIKFDYTNIKKMPWKCKYSWYVCNLLVSCRAITLHLVISKRWKLICVGFDLILVRFSS